MYWSEPSMYGVTLPFEKIQNPAFSWQWQNVSRFLPQSFLPQNFGYANPFHVPPTWSSAFPTFPTFPSFPAFSQVPSAPMIPNLPMQGFPFQNVPFQGLPYFGGFPMQSFPFYGGSPIQNIPFAGGPTPYPWYRPFVG